jgi:hypothetical protein
MNNDVIWVGVSLDAADNPRVPRSSLSRVHDTIVSIITDPRVYGTRQETRFPNDAAYDIYACDPTKGAVMDLFDAMGFRIGFGIKVDSVDQGTRIMPRVRDWMLGLGIGLNVSVWTWSPASVPSYTIRRVNARRSNVRR